MNWFGPRGSCGCCKSCDCFVCQQQPAPSCVSVTFSNVQPTDPQQIDECCDQWNRSFELFCSPTEACTWTTLFNGVCASPCGANNPIPERIRIQFDNVTTYVDPPISFGGECEALWATPRDLDLVAYFCPAFGQTICYYAVDPTDPFSSGINAEVTGTGWKIYGGATPCPPRPSLQWIYSLAPPGHDCSPPIDPLPNTFWNDCRGGTSLCCIHDEATATITELEPGPAGCSEVSLSILEWKLIEMGGNVTGELTIVNPENGDGE